MSDFENENKFNKVKYNNDFNKNNYDRLNIVVPKGQKQVIQDFAKSKGKSLNAFVYELVQKEIEKG